jgi:glycogen synthase kinase 3 beta
MNPNYKEFKFPQIRAHPWPTIFKANTPPDVMDLISKLLAYVPENRLKSIESCNHPFFAELREPGKTMPDGSPLAPELFQFTTEEMVMAPPNFATTLLPPGMAASNYVPPVNSLASSLEAAASKSGSSS